MKRLLSGFLALLIILSISTVALAQDDKKLPGEGQDGLPNGKGHDWAAGTKGNMNDNKEELIEKFIERGNPGYRNHMCCNQ
ncbi:MAG: hypothetical protein PHP02_05435 [Eubacteriales bacterium]|nr:hypothetical protein [Eubacteriales bacterium]